MRYSRHSAKPRALFLVLLAVSCSLAASNRVAAPADFDEWLRELREDARRAGISEGTLDEAFAGVAPIERVLELDRNQPETRMDFWTYLDRVASRTRIEEGRRRLAGHRTLVAELESRYGVPAPVLVAVWGIESNFGTNQGGFPVIASLATLAWDERRGELFRDELIEALRILEEGHVSVDAMRGSWAGAMGQVQFMPSTFNAYARDGDGDGRLDIWQSEADALASAAAFMSANWQPGYIWGRQVRLPEDFDRSLAGLATSKPLAEWEALGVRRADRTPLPRADIGGSILLPDGEPNPAFLVYRNFRVLREWNRSNLFALSVGHLADRIAGLEPLAH